MTDSSLFLSGSVFLFLSAIPVAHMLFPYHEKINWDYSIPDEIRWAKTKRIRTWQKFFVGLQAAFLATSMSFFYVLLSK